ncbi:hypothetical protein GJ496_003835 [Pomphorhynchus laevis]|nr:hypothetical protein GJ496_003835 [Pomphorhynchus laevis]
MFCSINNTKIVAIVETNSNEDCNCGSIKAVRISKLHGNMFMRLADENADNRSESLNRRVILSTNARIEFISRNGESAVVENRIASLSEYSIAEFLKYFEVIEGIAQISIVYV